MLRYNIELAGSGGELGHVEVQDGIYLGRFFERIADHLSIPLWQLRLFDADMTEIEFTTETQSNPITEDVLPTDQPLIRVIRDMYDSHDQIPGHVRLKSNMKQNVATEERPDGMIDIKIPLCVPRWRVIHRGRKMIGGGGSVCFQLKSKFPFVLRIGTPHSGGVEYRILHKDPIDNKYTLDIPDGLVTDLVQDSMVVVYPQTPQTPQNPQNPQTPTEEDFVFEGIYGHAHITSKDKILYANKYVTKTGKTGKTDKTDEFYYCNGLVKLVNKI